MTRLLIHSNAPWAPTGYGNQVGLVAPALADDYDVAISAFYGLEGAPIRWRGIPVLPGLGGEFGNPYLVEHARHFFGDPRAGLLMTLMDVWVMKPKVIAELNSCCWVPVDHDPVSPAISEFFEESQAIPIAMSRFGQGQLEEFGALYCPHAVDTNIFRPDADAREELGLDPDAFIVGMVAANKGRPSRKGFQQAFEAFRYFRERHENAVLYLHTVMSTDWAAGEELAELIASLEIPAESVLIGNQYRMQFAPPAADAMARLYAAFDVLLNPAYGEGFGIPILEAQACGTPAIVTDFSAMPEVCGEGWKVSGRAYWTGQRSWQAIPDVGEILAALEEAYARDAGEVAAGAARARDHALGYDLATVLSDHLLPALAEVEERIGKLPGDLELVEAAE